MPDSPRYEELRCNLALLRQRLLPASFSLTGSYNDRVLLHCAAYRVMAHAEMEHYLEDMSWSIVKSAKAKWDAGQGINKVLENLIVHSGLICQSPPRERDQAKALVTSEQFVRNAIEAYNVNVRKKNNGVRASSLLSLFVPLGFSLTDFDAIYLADMDNFGKDRGELAHQSPRTTRQLWTLDPANELLAVSNILTGKTPSTTISGLDQLDQACITRL